MNVMYYMYLSEERRSNGQNETRPSGLRPKMAPCRVARRSFGFTKPHSLRLCLVPFWASNAATWGVLTGPGSDQGIYYG